MRIFWLRGYVYVYDDGCAAEGGVLQNRAVQVHMGGSAALPATESHRNWRLRLRLVSVSCVVQGVLYMCPHVLGRGCYMCILCSRFPLDWIGLPFISLICTVFCCSSSALDTVNNVRVALKKLARPFQTGIHALRTYRELRYLNHMKHENVSCLIKSRRWLEAKLKSL